MSPLYSIPLLVAHTPLSARWGWVTLGVGALIFIYIVARLAIEHRRRR